MTMPSIQSVSHDRPPLTRVLVLGATGMVGRSWIEHLRVQGIECDGLARPEFDLMDPDSITRCLAGPSKRYDLVVNAAAWTDVDGAEADEPGAMRANAHAVAEIAELCKDSGSMLITYSTDYVFAGDAQSPYAIDAPINPINAYGRSKALGESLLRDSGPEHILIRTSWVYAPWGTNFVRTISKLAQSRDELQVVNDQRGRPTSAQHLAKSSLALYLKGALGTWHLTDADECTWFDFATRIAKRINPSCSVRPCGSETYPRPAARPGYSTLNITDSTDLIGPIGSWETHLCEVLGLIPETTSGE
jgi:dTDP-4-dehydrorhamnose reductase